MKEFFLKNNFLFKTLKILGFVFLVSILLKPTIVLDRKTFKPVFGVEINYYHYGFPNGCSSGNWRKINGITFSPLSFSRCQVSVQKENYHFAGSNKIRELPGFFGVRIIFMNKISNPQEFIKFKKTFSNGEGMDVLSFIQDYQSDNDPENWLGNIENDFILKGDEIFFFGDGGVREVSRYSTRSEITNFFYDLDNLMMAPRSGYKQQLKLNPEKSYIARLRDGQHYIFFYVFKNGMTVFVNPKPTRNMEVGGFEKACRNLYDTIFSIDSSTEDCYSGEYAIKKEYLKLKKEVEGDNFYLTGPWSSNSGLRVKELSRCFYLFPNEDRYSPGEIVSGYSLPVWETGISIRLPPYDLFKKYFDFNETCTKVDVFINGHYVN